MSGAPEALVDFHTGQGQRVAVEVSEPCADEACTMCKYPKNTWSCWKCKDGYEIQDEEYRCKFYNCEGKCIEAKSTPTSKGSCYEFWNHKVTCDVAKEDCGTGKAYYEPGYVGSSGCCHCEASCDHSKETAKDACEYYDAEGSEVDGDATPAPRPSGNPSPSDAAARVAPVLLLAGAVLAF